MAVDFKEKVVTVMAGLVGENLSKSIVDAASKFDNPKTEKKAFTESCKKAFSDLVGEDIVKQAFAKI